MRAKPAGQRPEDRDSDAVAYEEIDWDHITPVDVELDPELVERIHSRRRLKPLTLRVGSEQITEARRQAAETGQKYQAVLRGWLAAGASRARQERMRAEALAGSEKGVPKTKGSGTRSSRRSSSTEK